jgi:signal transduction histidine kinase
MEDEKGILSITLLRKKISAEEINGESGVSPGPFIVLEVSDTGHGMDQTMMGHIFDPYFTTKEAGKGTGLGLSVIYGIVQACQGFIKVESEPGRGTTFHVY